MKSSIVAYGFAALTCVAMSVGSSAYAATTPTPTQLAQTKNAELAAAQNQRNLILTDEAKGKITKQQAQSDLMVNQETLSLLNSLNIQSSPSITNARELQVNFLINMDSRVINQQYGQSH